MAAPRDPEEIWQVEVGGQVYEAPLRELPEWIEEGSLQPDDMVRKEPHRWAKARHIPTLIPFFNAKEKGHPLPVLVRSTDASSNCPADPPPKASPSNGPATSALVNPILSSGRHLNIDSSIEEKKKGPKGYCVRHPLEKSHFRCDGCKEELCRSCPDSYGGNVKLCPSCGSLCRSLVEAHGSSKYEPGKVTRLSEPFGFSDFHRAVSFPFQFTSSLLIGGAMFAVFTLGRSTPAIGGLLFIGASLMCAMLANMLTFGTLVNTISNFTQGRFDSDFLPAFDDLSLWNDVVHPFFLSIGAYLSSFGPFILALAIGIYQITGALEEQRKKFEQELTRVPGTPLYAPDRTVEQSKDVQELIKRVREQNESRLKAAHERALRETEAAETGMSYDPHSDRFAKSLGSDTADMGALSGDPALGLKDVDQTAASVEPATDPTSVLMNALRLSAPLVVILAISLLWGLGYFPAACAVAGYSRSFVSTVNPLVGIDTIRRMGFVYLKLFGMCTVLAVSGAIVGIILQLVFSPFYLPWIGNLPATFIGGFVSFYLWVIFCCILGYSLAKSVNRLGLAS